MSSVEMMGTDKETEDGGRVSEILACKLDGGEKLIDSSVGSQASDQWNNFTEKKISLSQNHQSPQNCTEASAGRQSLHPSPSLLAWRR